MFISRAIASKFSTRNGFILLCHMFWASELFDPVDVDFSVAMCSRRFQKACTLGEPVLSSNSGRLQLDSKWYAFI